MLVGSIIVGRVDGGGITVGGRIEVALDGLSGDDNLTSTFEISPLLFGDHSEVVGGTLASLSSNAACKLKDTDRRQSIIGFRCTLEWLDHCEVKSG